MFVSRKLLVVSDGCIPTKCVGAMARWFGRQRFGRFDVDSHASEYSLHWRQDVTLDVAGRPTVQTISLLGLIDRRVRISLPALHLELTEIRAYATVYGDLPTTHRDSDTGATITAIAYMHRDWQPDWGGELIVCEDKGDARIAIAPRPGRLVIFRGDLPHRAGAPSRLCFSSRNALVFRYTIKNQASRVRAQQS
jgi:hypothetical protein